MESIPFYIGILFTAVALITVWFLYKAAGSSLLPVIIITAWAVVQSILAMNSFYRDNTTIPPRIALLLVPMLMITVVILVRAKQFIGNLDLKWLTLLHTVRLPVEIGLFLLYTEKLVPGLMTFEGGNLDILSGITAPFVYYFTFVKPRMSFRFLLLWNFLCLFLLINILIRAILSVPTPIQQLAFEQPNTGILYFPVILLPAVIVPLVLLSQLAAIKRLWKKENGFSRFEITAGGKQ